MLPRLICLLGLAVFVALAWAISSNRRKFPVRIVVGGLLLQFVLAFLVLRTTPGRELFDMIGDGFNAVLGTVTDGSGFLFNFEEQGGAVNDSLLMTFAFHQMLTAKMS